MSRWNSRIKLAIAASAVIGIISYIGYFWNTSHGEFAGLEFATATKADLKEKIKELSPKAAITEKPDTISAKGVKLMGETYDLSAIFRGEDTNSTLMSLNLRTRWKEQGYAVLQTFQRDQERTDRYTSDRLVATVDTDGKTTSIKITQPWPKMFAAVAPYLLILCALVLLRGFFRRPLMTICLSGLGYIAFVAVHPYSYPEWAVGVVILYAIITWRYSDYHTAGNMYAAPQGYAFEQPSEHQEINPANGLPMYGGVDIHGNHHGSNFNDPI